LILKYLSYLMIPMKGFGHFFPVPAVQSQLLTIRGIGVQEHMEPCIIDRPTGTGDHMFMLFYGDVWIGAGDVPRRWPRGGLMMWTPGTHQYYGNTEKPFVHSWMHCDGSYIQDLLKSNGIPTNQPFEWSDPSIIERYLLAIHEELIRYARPDEGIVKSQLHAWMREVARVAGGSVTTVQEIPGPFLALRHFMESDYAQPMTLAGLARRVNLSVPHFCAEFKRHFGTSAIDYLIRQRMHQAAYLLKDRNLQVTDVARRVGYDDLFHFSKLFKRHYGMSPRALRSGGR
jgi:AraC family transcriptional regulator of arabinose operon